MRTSCQIELSRKASFNIDWQKKMSNLKIFRGWKFQLGIFTCVTTLWKYWQRIEIWNRIGSSDFWRSEWFISSLSFSKLGIWKEFFRCRKMAELIYQRINISRACWKFYVLICHWYLLFLIYTYLNRKWIN